MQRRSRAFDEETQIWRVSPRMAVVLFSFPFAAGALLGVVGLVRDDLARRLLLEDSVVEWATTLASLAAGMLAAIVAARLWRDALRPQAAAYAFLTFAAVVAAGEEISWGQRVLGVEPPASVREANLQEELNIHNLDAVYPLYVAGMVLVGLYGSVGSWFVYRFKRWRSPNWYLFMPPVFLAGAFIQLAAYRLIRYTGITGGRDYGEWCELCVAAAIATFVALNLRRLRSEQ
jgi:hypothetical protein